MVTTIAKDDWVKLLAQGGNAFLSELDRAVGSGLERLDLSGARLAGLDLRNPGPIPWDLSRADLTGAKVLVRHLQECRLEGAKLDKAEFEGDPSIIETIFRLWGPDDIWNAYRKTATIPVLYRVDLSGAKLAGKNIDTLTFTGANLSKIEISGAALKAVDFTNAKLDGVRALGTGFERCKFVDGSLQAALFDEARLRLCFMSRAKAASASFRGAAIKDLTASGASFEGASFAGSKLEGVLFDDANLVGANFAGATLADVDLGGADVAGADFRGASGYDLDDAENGDRAIL